MPSSASARGGATSTRLFKASSAASTWRSAVSLSLISRPAVGALGVQIDGEAAARQVLGDRLADARLESLEAGRQAQRGCRARGC